MAGTGARLRVAGTKADLGAVDARDARLQHGLDRRRPAQAEAGWGGAVIGAEPQHDADFVGQDPVKAAGRQPQRHDDDDDERDAFAGAKAEAAGKGAAQAVLTAPQNVFDIGRHRPARAARPLTVAAPAAPGTAAARPGAPRTTGLTMPDHR